MNRGESSASKVGTKRTSSLLGRNKRGRVNTASSSVIKTESIQIPSEDVLPVKIGEELDKNLADERSPPTIEDQMRTLFRSAILDHLIVSWDSELCMRNIYGKPPPTPSATLVSSTNPSLALSSILSFTSDAQQSQHEMHAKKRRKSRKSVDESATIVARQASLEKRKKERNFSSTSKEVLPGVAEVKQEKPTEFPLRMEGIPSSSKQSTRSKETVQITPSKEGDSIQLAEDSSLREGKIASSRVIEPVKHWDPPSFPDENVTVTFLNGNKYVGRVSRKLMDGEGHYIWNDGRSYKGDFVDGKMTGQGHFEWADLNTYCGNMICGWRHGKGSFVFYDVNVAYEGDWFWGLKHGQGIALYNWNLNDWYWGDWKNDLYDGYGKRHYPNGAYFIGEWRYGRRHGIGSQIWPNCDLYRGGWQSGAMNGYGEYIWSLSLNRGFSMNPGNYFLGNFLNGLRHGSGELHISNGASISGQWVDDLKQGQATVTAGNGKVIRGDPLFLDDRALPKERPSPGERSTGTSTLYGHDGEVVKVLRHGTKLFWRSTIEMPNQPEVPAQDFHKWAHEIPLRLPDHEIELGYHIKRLRAHKYPKVAGSTQTEGHGSVFPFADMPEYFSDDEDSDSPKLSRSQSRSGSRILKEKARSLLGSRESHGPSQSTSKQSDLLKIKPKKVAANAPRLPNATDLPDARKAVKKLSPPKESMVANSPSGTNVERKYPAKSSSERKDTMKSASQDDTGSVSQGGSQVCIRETIYQDKPAPRPEWDTQTPPVWFATSEDKNTESETQATGRRVRHRTSGHNTVIGSSGVYATEYKVPPFDNMREEDYEVKWIRKVILNHLTVLRKIYDKYTNLGCKTPDQFKPLMPRLTLWLLYRDCGFHKRGLSMNEIDEMLAARPDSGVVMPHCPMERVYFWQFLHSLLDVSWVLYARHGIHGRLERGTLAGALDKLIVDDVIPNTLAVPHESVFLENVDLVPLDDAYDLYRTQPQPYTARCFLANVFPRPWTKPVPEMCCCPLEMLYGHNAFSMAEVPVFIPGETPLLGGEVCYLTARLASLAGIGPKKVVEILAQECPAIMEDGVIINIDYPLSFVEWYEVVIMCAKAGLTKEKTLYQKRLAEEEQRKELQALEQPEQISAQSMASAQSVSRNKKSSSRQVNLSNQGSSQFHSIMKQRPISNKEHVIY